MSNLSHLRRTFLKPHPNFIKSSKRKLQGVWWERSVYYMWYRYLQLSDRYRQACLGNGQGMPVMFADFGDVFSVDFPSWWKQPMADGTPRGMYLFAEKAYMLPTAFCSFEQLESQREAIEYGEALAILIPNFQPKTKVTKLIKRIMTDYASQGQEAKSASTARYKLSNYTKNSIQSLRDGLRAVELDKLLRSKREVGLVLKYEALSEGNVYSGQDVDEINDMYNALLRGQAASDKQRLDFACHMYASRLLGKGGRVEANIKAVEQALPTPGQRGWGEFPAKL